MSDISLKVEKISKRFFRRSDNTSFWALKNISFELAKGEMLGITGSNGSGKSTLLNILSGILPPSEGQILHKGNISAILSLGSGMHPELSGYRNIYYYGQLLGYSNKEIKAKEEEIIAFSGIENSIDEPIKNYSSGMFLRLAFSVMVVLSNEILLLDEVISVGDYSFTRKCLEKIEQMKIEGRTIILVTHSLDMLARLCDKVLLLDKGIQRSYGTPLDVLSFYSTIQQDIVMADRAGTISTQQNAVIRNLSVRKAGATDERDNIFLAEEEVQLDIDFEVVTSLPFLSASILVSDTILQQSLFACTSLDLKAASQNICKAGHHRLQLTIPDNLFNNGLFLISIYWHNKEHSIIALHSDCYKFEVKRANKLHVEKIINHLPLWPKIQLNYENIRHASQRG